MRSLVLFFLVFSWTAVQAQDAYPVDSGEVLLDGYDPVAYFDSQVLKGKKQFAYVTQGRWLLFSSQENLDRFREDPQRYQPAYGGWCAIAMVDTTFVVPDYTLYKIQDGALMFFSIRAFFNGLTEWDKDPDKNKVKADGNYRGLFAG